MSFDDLLPPSSTSTGLQHSLYNANDSLGDENPFADLQSSNYVNAFQPASPIAARRQSSISSNSNESSKSAEDTPAAAPPLNLPHAEDAVSIYDNLVSPLSESGHPSPMIPPQVYTPSSVKSTENPFANSEHEQSTNGYTADASAGIHVNAQINNKESDLDSLRPASIKTVALSSSSASTHSDLTTTNDPPHIPSFPSHGGIASPKAQAAEETIQSVIEAEQGQEQQVSLKSGRPSYLITVSDPHKVGSDLTASSHVIYTVKSISVSSTSSQPNPPRSVLRRYRDFLWLFDSLIANNQGVVVPPPPEKSALGRFGHDFIENRRKRLQVFLGKVAAHPILWNDPDFKMFLESDSFALDIRNRAAPVTPATPSFFLPGILSSTPRFTEPDEFFIQRQSDLLTLEGSLKTLSTALLTVTKARSSLLSSIQELAHAVANLEACELTQTAKKSLGALEELTSKLAGLEENVILSGESTLSSVIDSWVRLSSTSVKFAFNARLKSWTSWQKQISLRATLEKKRNMGQASLQDCAEQDAKVEEGKREFMDISRLIKFELLRFDEERMEDFRLGLVEYVEGLQKRQVEVVKCWVAYGEIVQQCAGANVDRSSQAGN